MTIRKAALDDVPTIFAIISHHAAARLLLPRPLAELYECVREFLVAVEKRQVVACGALKIYSADLAEIRSLCVAPGVESRGLGRALIKRLLREAESFGVKTAFALTLVPDFFRKCGFEDAAREKFPAKIWRDCLRCARYGCCNEKAVWISLPTPRSSAEFRAASSPVPA